MQAWGRVYDLNISQISGDAGAYSYVCIMCMLY